MDDAALRGGDVDENADIFGMKNCTQCAHGAMSGIVIATKE